MKKYVVLVLSLLVMLAPLTSFAAGTDGVKEPLLTARQKLVALIGTADKGTQTALIGEIKTATKAVDDQAEALLVDAATPDDQKAKLTEFKAVWGEFKTTRDTEIIPAVQAGDPDKAKGIAQGIQVERFKKMLALLQ